ncbi:NAD-dependent epimerase/dehydratase family protein [bacterium]
MKILLTGGSGFIGKNILGSCLSKKYEIIAPSHKDLDLTDEDAVQAFFDKNKIDIVLHSACKPGHRNAKDSSGIFFNNTRMFFNLARNSNKFKKMIITGSGAIYDMRHYKPKMKEEYFGDHVPIDEHGFSKYVCEKYIEKTDNIIDLRIFGIFGKYEDYAIRFISNLICKVIFDVPLTINQNKKFDYLYIDDLMPVLDYFIQHDANHSAYNVTPDNSIELLELAEKIKKISGKDLPIIIKKDGLGSEYSGDNSLLKTEMTQVIFTDIDEAIEELYNYYLSIKDKIKKEQILVDK